MQPFVEKFHVEVMYTSDQVSIKQQWACNGQLQCTEYTFQLFALKNGLQNFAATKRSLSLA